MGPRTDNALRQQSPVNLSRAATRPPLPTGFAKVLTPRNARHRIALARDDLHRVSKQPVERLRLVAGLGVEGDAHAGLTMQHRSRWVKRKPTLSTA